MKRDHKEENARLVDEYRRTGSQKTLKELIEGNQPMIRKMARSFNAPGEMEDLVSEGVAGLLHALDTYDSEKGRNCSNFMTYAYWWIRRYMQLYMDSLRTISVPSSTSYKMIQTGRGEELERYTYHEPLDSREAMKASVDDADLDRRLLDDDMHDRIMCALGNLKNRKAARAVTLYYGLEDGRSYRMKTIAEMLECSESTISKYIKAAFNELRDNSALEFYWATN